MRPQDILPDHVNEISIGDLQVRKGSVAAFIANALIVTDPQTSDAERAEAEQHLTQLVPALTALKLFEVFEIRNPHVRALVGR
ncbi:MAG TPA: hypothetical protein VH165_15990 [Kofleriaceae bacterium]|jgi:hypothetical protein|nr:hypothetical protein [Kofleriaceae bacterium]